MKFSKIITYEQPVNEHTRICLRLEQLFKRINQFIGIDSLLHTQQTLDSLIEIIALTDRADLKNLLLGELRRMHSHFTRLKSIPNIDHVRLNELLTRIQQIIETLVSSERKLLESLRQNDFLAAIRLQKSNPGGVAPFDQPHYYYWLHLPYETRRSCIDNWLEGLNPLKITVTLLLQLIRDSSYSEMKTANKGTFQHVLDPKIPCQLIRIAIPIEAHAYPEISVGPHRLYVRFFSAFISALIHERPDIITKDLDFQLTCCAL